eukprot:scaffold231608_cov28-Tisochrysis_lutea.AAC.1
MRFAREITRCAEQLSRHRLKHGGHHRRHVVLHVEARREVLDVPSKPFCLEAGHRLRRTAAGWRQHSVRSPSQLSEGFSSEHASTGGVLGKAFEVLLGAGALASGALRRRPQSTPINMIGGGGIARANPQQLASIGCRSSTGRRGVAVASICYVSRVAIAHHTL